MNASTAILATEERFARLEARIAELELMCEAAQMGIPWHVICAAVATVLPNVRIVSVAPAPGRDKWSTNALLRNLNSHQIR